MNHLKKIIIGILFCTFGITLLTIPDNQILKTNKKKISNNFDKPKSTNKVSSKKTFFFFIIIGIVVIVVIILIISLIVWLIKRRNNKLAKEDFLSKKCYFTYVSNVMKICFGSAKISIAMDTIFFNKDISSETKQQFNFYKILANDQNLKNSLIAFYYSVATFFFEIDGHLLKVCYDPNNNSNTPLTQMSKNFNETTFVDRIMYDDIFSFNKTNATRPLSENEKQLLNSKNYVDLFKTIMHQDTIPYYEEEKIIQKQQLLNSFGCALVTTQNEKLPLFEYCHAIYMKIKDIYSELTTFFSKPENKKHSNKYKLKIDSAMNAINTFLEIKQKNTQSPS